jgi:hypothetical protein
VKHGRFCASRSTIASLIYIYIEREREMAYGALQSKKPLLLRGEISYPEVSNDQFKLLNNFFISKSYKILNFMFF